MQLQSSIIGLISVLMLLMSSRTSALISNTVPFVRISTTSVAYSNDPDASTVVHPTKFNANRLNQFDDIDKSSNVNNRFVAVKYVKTSRADPVSDKEKSATSKEWRRSVESTDTDKRRQAWIAARKEEEL
mmetsp:Transcript_2180/g.2356  ORF Transcript_2180/g.2356 Transcript_2180/m.2356 type:complete len:130 (+) Transcript_2180:131-520(+)|eukprot:CAMPEP_0198264592 /NCGR_PEP_ID=MMETSP1447-20131203/16242_1 /TAXON_ID=420782 /ORGANISM="Chaetoceros dichaeta, Strain CCMP1751" /LENGTH=129 /DNA_ID=CAMNT_0043953579 /DNA_START=101 /DNA_END=490 /DNA_ORIENTATION=+